MILQNKDDGSKLEIRDMNLNDVIHVHEIESQMADFPWGKNIFRDCVLIGYGAWVVELNNKIIGFALMTVDKDRCHIVNITIHKEHHRKGFGRELMNHMIHKAKQAETKEIILEVRVSNEPAITLYKSLGFREIGIKPAYYEKVGNQREDGLLMSLRFHA